MLAFLPAPFLAPRRVVAPSRCRRVPAMSAARALLAVATGSEEIETATALSVLTRAGVAVTVAAAAPARTVTLSRGLQMSADTTFADLPPGDAFDVLVLPGGAGGAKELAGCAPLEARVRAALAGADGPVVGAICAAPALCLGAWGLLGEGARVTGYPAAAFEEACGKAYVRGEDVVVDGRLITSQGPATAMAWALALVGAVLGEETRRKISAEVLFE